MNYLADSEFQTYGLEPDTPESWVSAASSLINSYCNRPTLWISQFTERVRLTPSRNNLRLTYLPLAIPTAGSRLWSPGGLAMGFLAAVRI